MKITTVFASVLLLMSYGQCVFANLPPCSPGIYDDCVGIAEYANGKYVGEFKDGNRHGRGFYTFKSGERYDGEWVNGQKHGNGVHVLSGGDKYEGDFRFNLRNGWGIYTNAVVTRDKGRKFEGEWVNDFQHGLGVWIDENGNQHPGQWENGVFSGSVDLATVQNRRVDRQIASEGQKEEGGGVQKTPDLQDDKIYQTSSGSAFAVSEDGFLVTNHHVINGCQEVNIHVSGDILPAKVVMYDAQNDLALLKSKFTPRHAFSIRIDDPSLLEDVFVAGFPFGHELSTSIKVTKGIVSALTGNNNNFSNMQIDAAIQKGNSGGPIIDRSGNVIGVAVSKLSFEYALEEFGSIPENVNFGVKSSVIRNILNSQRVALLTQSDTLLDMKTLGNHIADGTYYVSCWMTGAQINTMKETKVMFENIK